MTHDALGYRDHTYIRLISTRTGETSFEVKMLGGSIIVWGAHYRPSEFGAYLADDGQTVARVGTLRDRIGPVLTFGDCFDVHAACPPLRVPIGV
jgi:hypothetical protein